MKALRVALMMAFLVGQYTTGQTKQCIYEGMGNQYTITISWIKLCPISINI